MGQATGIRVVDGSVDDAYIIALAIGADVGEVISRDQQRKVLTLRGKGNLGSVNAFVSIKHHSEGSSIEISAFGGLSNAKPRQAVEAFLSALDKSPANMAGKLADEEEATPAAVSRQFSDASAVGDLGVEPSLISAPVQKPSTVLSEDIQQRNVRTCQAPQQQMELAPIAVPHHSQDCVVGIPEGAPASPLRAEAEVSFQQCSGNDDSGPYALLLSKGSAPIPHNALRPWIWFALVNAAVLATTFIPLRWFSIVFLILGAISPFVILLISKSLAIRSHGIHLLSVDSAADEAERNLVRLVQNLSGRAGLETPPDVGIYESDDMNAFATGASRNNSLVAFSSSLLAQMDEESVAAVAAHEVAHIANGDMFTMTVVQAGINTIVLSARFLCRVTRWFWSSEEAGKWVDIAGLLFELLLVNVLMITGNLLAKLFSRRREFEADRCAALLMRPESMIGALQALGQQTVSFSEEQKAYASFKICSPTAVLDIFSTHPSIERRIDALRKMA